MLRVSYWNLIRKNYFQAPTLKLRTHKFSFYSLCSCEEATTTFVCNQIDDVQDKNKVSCKSLHNYNKLQSTLDAVNTIIECQ